MIPFKKNTTCVIALLPGVQLFGSERGNIQALLALKSSGIRVVVGVSNRTKAGGPVGDLVREFGFETFELPYGGNFDWYQMRTIKSYRRRQIKRLWTNSLLLLKAIKQYNATHVITGSLLAFLFCGIALTLKRVKLIYRMGDAPEATSYFQLTLWKWMVRRANLIVAISNFIKTQADSNSNWAARKIHVIRNPLVKRPGEIDTLKVNQLQSTKSYMQLVYVGQITPQKGIKELVESLIKLDNPAIGCWIVGGSPYTQQFEQELMNCVKESRSRTKIEFHGFQADPRPYYATSDWHVAPSKYEEPLGNVVQEAKSHSVPSIISPHGGLPELVTHGVDGFILPTITAQAIADQVNEIRHKEDRWNDYGEAALASLEKNLNQEEFNRKWYMLFRSI